MVDAPEPYGPFDVILAPAEIEAVASRYGLREALSGGLTARHHAPLAAFVLALLFAAILALTGLISHRAGEAAFLIAAAAFMIQRLATHRRIWRARNTGRAEIERFLSGPLTTTIDGNAVVQTCGGKSRRLDLADCQEVEETGGLVYLWGPRGTPVVVPSRAMAEGQASRLVVWARDRIRAAKL
jgi:hypothetical protein